MVLTRCKGECSLLRQEATSAIPSTKELWVYDLRSSRNFSLRQNPIGSNDMRDFIDSYHADDITKRSETLVFRKFGYSDIIARGKANLDIHWKLAETVADHGSSPQYLPGLPP